MTDEMMNLRALLEKSSEVDLLPSRVRCWRVSPDFTLSGEVRCRTKT
jgi:hypothetical protein